MIDAHVHVSSARYIPDRFLLGVAKNANAIVALMGIEKDVETIVEHMKLEHQDHDCDQLVKNMDECEIHKTILLLPDFTYWAKTDLTIDEMYDEHYKIVGRHKGRFAVFCGIDPRSNRDTLKLFKRGVEEYGFSGMKLYPPCGYSPSDERLYPLYEYCEKNRLPVLLHTGPTSPSMTFEYSNPYHIDKAAREFEGVNFILAHGGVFNIKEAIEMCAYRPNVFLDIAGFSGTLYANGWQASLTELFRCGINHKIIFGTDWPVLKYPGGTKALIRQFDDVLKTCSFRDKELITSKNIVRITPALQ